MDNRIRRATRKDAAAIRAIYAPAILDSATSFEVDVPSVAEIEKRIQDLGDAQPWLVFDRGGVVIGYAYASPHRARKAYQWSVEVSVYIDANFQGRGVGRALYTVLFDLLRRQGYVNAYAGMTLPNPGSARLHESMGFSRIGVYSRTGFKFGRWHDVAWSELRLAECDEPVPSPLSVKGLLQDGGVEALIRKACGDVRFARSPRLSRRGL